MDNSNSQRKVLISAAAGIGLENMDIMFLSFSMASIIATFGISGTQAGWIGTITNFGMLLGGIIFGMLADKIGRVKVFSYTVIIFSVASALMFFASNIYLVYLFRLLQELVRVVNMVLVCPWYQNQHLKRNWVRQHQLLRLVGKSVRF